MEDSAEVQEALRQPALRRLLWFSQIGCLALGVTLVSLSLLIGPVIPRALLFSNYVLLPVMRSLLQKRAEENNAASIRACSFKMVTRDSES